MINKPNNGNSLFLCAQKLHVKKAAKLVIVGAQQPIVEESKLL
jgi:hypothetical protein